MVPAELPLVSVYDVGRNWVGNYPLPRVARYVNDGSSRIVRDRRGRVRRIYWTTPILDSEPFRNLKLADYAGQRYVDEERIAEGPRKWKLRDLRHQPQAAFLKVVRERGWRAVGRRGRSETLDVGQARKSVENVASSARRGKRHPDVRY